MQNNGHLCQFLVHLRKNLFNSGFDLFHLSSIQLYNQEICKKDKSLCVPDFGHKQTLSVLVGNTKHLWHFAKKFDKTDKNPLYSYCEQEIPKVLKNSLIKYKFYDEKNNNNLKLKYELRHSHETSIGRLVAFQQATHFSGLGYLDATSYLCIHPIYGPWISLRAMIVFDIDINVYDNQFIQLLKTECINNKDELLKYYSNSSGSGSDNNNTNNNDNDTKINSDKKEEKEDETKTEEKVEKGIEIENKEKELLLFENEHIVSIDNCGFSIGIKNATNPCSKEELENVQMKWKDVQVNVLNVNSNNITSVDVRQHWKYWVALRKAYNIGKKYQFSDLQNAYHYGAQPQTDILNQLV